MPNEISVVFYNSSKYDYHFIIKELAIEFEGQFECFWWKYVTCKTFSVPIKKEVIKINKDGNKSVETISYKIKFIDSMRFMTNSLSKVVVNLTEGINKIKSKECDCFLEYESINGNSIKYKCLSFDKDHFKKLDGDLKKKFKNTFKFSNNDINKFIWLLRKSVYLYKYTKHCYLIKKLFTVNYI